MHIFSETNEETITNKTSVPNVRNLDGNSTLNLSKWHEINVWLHLPPLFRIKHFHYLLVNYYICVNFHLNKHSYDARLTIMHFILILCVWSVMPSVFSYIDKGEIVFFLFMTLFLLQSFKAHVQYIILTLKLKCTVKPVCSSISFPNVCTCICVKCSLPCILFKQ